MGGFGLILDQQSIADSIAASFRDMTFDPVTGTLIPNPNPPTVAQMSGGTCATGSEGHCKCDNCKCCPEDSYVRTAQLTVFEDVETARNYARRAGCPEKSLYYPTVIIMAHRIPWWKAAPGDCGTQSNVSLGNIGIASKAAGIESSFAGGLSTAGIASSITPILTGVGVIASAILLPLSIIGAHHAQAVAIETETGCEISVAYNAFADQLETAVKSGQLSLADALNVLSQAVNQVMGSINSIAKTSGDAGALMRYGLKGLTLLNKEKVLPALAQQGQAAIAAAQQPQQQIAKNPSAANSPSTPNGTQQQPKISSLVAVAGLAAVTFLAKLLMR